MLQLIFIGLAICSYLVALVTPAFKATNGSSHTVEGYVCFFFGLLGIIHNLWMTVAWLANIPFFIALFYIMGKKSAEMAIILATFSLLLSFTSIWVDSTLVNEAGDTVPIKMSVGAYAWISAILFLLIASIITWKFPTV